MYSHKDPSPELVLVMRRNLTTWDFDEKACINWRSSENSRCETWNWRLPPVLKITMTLKISSQDINQTLGEMKERTKYYTNLPTKCVLGNNFFQEIFNSLKNLYIFPETYKWIWEKPASLFSYSGCMFAIKTPIWVAVEARRQRYQIVSWIPLIALSILAHSIAVKKMFTVHIPKAYFRARIVENIQSNSI